MVESAALFSRTLGEDSDVVSKVRSAGHCWDDVPPLMAVRRRVQEMYTFKDKSGNLLTLRPENTASARCRPPTGASKPVQLC